MCHCNNYYSTFYKSTSYILQKHFLQVNQEPNLFFRRPFFWRDTAWIAAHLSTSINRCNSRFVFSSCTVEGMMQNRVQFWKQKQLRKAWSWTRSCVAAACVLGIRLTVTLLYRKKGPPSCFWNGRKAQPPQVPVWPPCRIRWDSRPRGQFRETNLAKPRPIWPVFATKRPYDMLRDTINLSDVERSGTVKSTLFYSIHKIGYAAAHCSRLPLYSLLGCTCCASDKYK